MLGIFSSHDAARRGLREVMTVDHKRGVSTPLDIVEIEVED